MVYYYNRFSQMQPSPDTNQVPQPQPQLQPQPAPGILQVLQPQPQPPPGINQVPQPQPVPGINQVPQPQPVPGITEEAMPDAYQMMPEPSLGLYQLTFEQMNTIINFQILWRQMATWMRNLLMCIIGTLPNQMAVTNRVYVGVPASFEKVFAVFYGTELANYFRNLLAGFIQSGWNLMVAMKEGNVEAANAYTQRWYQSADRLAGFLGRMNVYWDRNQWRDYLYTFIRLNIEQMTAALGGDFEKEVQTFDSLENLAYLLGSYMARGIIARDHTIDNKITL